MDEYLGTSELARAVNDAMGAAASPKGRGNAADVPSERTIRYYLSEGMIPPPVGKKGVQLRFGRIHLLTVLAIKKLQELGVASNAGIKEMLTDKDEAELERFLDEDVEIKTAVDPLEIVQYRSLPPEKEVSESIVPPPPTNAAMQYFKDKLFPRPAASPPDMLFSQASPPAATPPRAQRFASAPVDTMKESEWRRYDIADGVELHVRGDIAKAELQRNFRGLVDKLKRILGL